MRQQIMTISIMFIFTTFSLIANNPFPDDFPQPNFSGPQYKFEREVLKKVSDKIQQVGQPTTAQSDRQRWDHAAAQALEGVTSATAFPSSPIMRSVYEHLPLEQRVQQSSVIRPEESVTLNQSPSTQQPEDDQAEVAPQIHEQAEVQENMPRPWSHVIKKLGMPILGGTIVMGIVLGLTHRS